MGQLIFKERDGGKIILHGDYPQYHDSSYGSTLIEAEGGIIEIGNDVAFGVWNVISAQNHIKIGDSSIFAERVSIRDQNHNYTDMSKHIKHQGFTTAPIIIGNGVWVASNVVITAGVTIGDGAIVGANAVVTKDIPAYAIAVGSPAKVIGYRSEDGIKKV